MNRNITFKDTGPGSLQSGVICAANESRFDAQFFSEPLTTYATGGWDNEPLQELLDFIAPKVVVSRRFDYKTFDIADEFNADDGDDDIRAIGANFGTVQPESKSEVQGKTDNKGLVVAIDLDELAGDPTLKTRAVKRIQRRLIRNEIRRALNMLSAAGVSAAKTWNTASDPDMDVKNAILESYKVSGVRPNRVLFGLNAWSLRDTAFRSQNTAGGFSSANKTVDQVGQYLVAQAMTLEHLYRDNAGALALRNAGDVLLFNAISGGTVEDPSNIKRFVSEGGGMKVYEQQVSSKVIEITVEHYSRIVLTSALGIRKLTIS